MYIQKVRANISRSFEVSTSNKQQLITSISKTNVTMSRNPYSNMTGKSTLSSIKPLKSPQMNDSLDKFKNRR